MADAAPASAGPNDGAIAALVKNLSNLQSGYEKSAVVTQLAELLRKEILVPIAKYQASTGEKITNGFREYALAEVNRAATDMATELTEGKNALSGWIKVAEDTEKAAAAHGNGG